MGMTKLEVFEKASAMHKQGFNYIEIAEKLAKEGAKNRNGDALRQGDVGYLLRSRKGTRRYVAGSKPKLTPEPVAKRQYNKRAPDMSKLEAVVKILKMRGHEAEERIALALMVLE